MRRERQKDRERRIRLGNRGKRFANKSLHDDPCTITTTKSTMMMMAMMMMITMMSMMMMMMLMMMMTIARWDDGGSRSFGEEPYGRRRHGPLRHAQRGPHRALRPMIISIIAVVIIVAVDRHNILHPCIAAMPLS
jgi:hypothetical protein